MALFKKQGVDKNGHQYTRLVRPEGDTGTVRHGRIPSPTIVSADEVDSYRDFIETSESIINNIPKSERINITPEQLDAVFGVMKEFGTQDDDSWGFRNHVAKKSDHGYEWSERGWGSRFNMDTDREGNIRNVSLYNIGSGNQQAEYPRFAEGQAKLRSALGLPEYNDSEMRYIATRYFDSQILSTLGDIPGDGGRGLRKKYVSDIMDHKELIPDLIEGLKEQPVDVVGNMSGYVETLGTPGKDYEPFLSKVREGKFVAAQNELSRYREFNDDQKRAINKKIDTLKKEAAREKRAAKKAAEAAATAS
jgi:hypothetical protein